MKTLGKWMAQCCTFFFFFGPFSKTTLLSEELQNISRKGSPLCFPTNPHKHLPSLISCCILQHLGTSTTHFLMFYMLIVYIVSLMTLLDSQIHVDKDVLLFNDESKISRIKDAWNSAGLHTVTKE